MIGLGLLRNRKGLDYSAFLVIVVFIAVVYLFIQLYAKLDVFTDNIGDQELALMSAYESGDGVSLFVDQSAKYSILSSVASLARNGGFVPGSAPCGIASSVAGMKYSFWFKDGKKCYPSDVGVHDSFKYYMSKNLDSFLVQAAYFIPEDNFEFTVADDRVIGVALRPVLVPLYVSPVKRALYGEVMAQVLREFGVPSLGVYVVRPSFSIDTQARLGDYAMLKSQVDALLDCIKTGSLDSCVKSAGSDELKWSYQQISGTDSFVFDVRQAKAVNPFSKNPIYIGFAMDLPGVRIQ